MLEKSQFYVSPYFSINDVISRIINIVAKVIRQTSA